tara:strand:- start:37913 stop:38269 length:357 start_codon:yes stop_codon:yes gene_type:complete
MLSSLQTVFLIPHRPVFPVFRESGMAFAMHTAVLVVVDTSDLSRRPILLDSGGTLTVQQSVLIVVLTEKGAPILSVRGESRPAITVQVSLIIAVFHLLEGTIRTVDSIGFGHEVSPGR